MSGLRLIDSHAHVQFAAYDADREAVIARAREGGVGIVNIGTQHSTSSDAVQLARQCPDSVWATVGFHPSHLDSDAHHDPNELSERVRETFDAGKLRELAYHPTVVAVGECGLDYYPRADSGQRIADSVRQAQKEIFRLQIELALEIGKPLVIHCRQAFPDLIEILKSYFLNPKSDRNGVVHFFSGSWMNAENLLDLGFYLGFGGVITFARDYDEVVRRAPLDRLLVETDAPFVAPVPHRGKRNEPAYIVETVKKIAELRGISYDEVAENALENARNLFRI